MRCTPAQLAAYVGHSERTIHRWLSSGKLPYKRLPGGLIEVDDSLLNEPESGQTSTILATLQRIEQKLDMLAASADTPSRTVRPETSVVTQDAFPEGLIPWRDYVIERGYSESTVARHIKAGDVPVHEGRWKRGQAIIKELIGEEGKQAIDRLYGNQQLPTD
jgi:hypothetical protein